MNRSLPLLLAAGVLSGCGGLVPTTLVRLGAVSPLEADPAGFAVTLDLPEGLGLQPGIGRLALTAERRDPPDRLAGACGLSSGPDGGIGVDPDEIDALRALQAEVAAWEAADPDGTSGSLSVTLDPCRIGAGPAPDARVSVAIRLEPGGPFLPLVRNDPISQVAGSDDIGALPQCG